MRKFIPMTIFFIFVFCSSSAMAAGFSDVGIIMAINSQTVTQTAEHLRRLAQMIQTIQTLQEQLTTARGLLDLAQQAAQGTDGLQAVGDFRNLTLATNDVIRSVQNYIDTTKDLPQRWKQLFGTLDPWVRDAQNVFANIDVSDKTSTSGYLIGDSYQRLYEQNAGTVAQFIADAGQVNEKGALKQIAQELAQLIQMENNTTYLLAQILKGQSVEASNDNLKRKEETIRLEDENQGIRAFMGIVDDQTFAI